MASVYTPSRILVKSFFPNFIKIGPFSLRYADITFFMLAAVRHLGYVMTSLIITNPVGLINIHGNF